MTCNNTFTTAELFTSLWIYDSSCSKKVSFINRALRVFYSRTTDLQDNMQMESFSIPWGDYNWSTTYPIYKVRSFYWRGSWPMFEEVSSLMEYNCDWCRVKRIKFTPWLHFLDDWQYKVDTACDNKLYIRTPNCAITNSSVVYSRWPDTITSVTQNISMSNFLRTWFEYLVEEMWSSRVEELNNTSYRNSQFEKWLESVTKIQAEWPEFIWID